MSDEELQKGDQTSTPLLDKNYELNLHETNETAQSDENIGRKKPARTLFAAYFSSSITRNFNDLDTRDIALKEDAYGLLLMITPKEGMIFFFAVIILILQISIIYLVAYYLLHKGIGDKISINPPAGITDTVRIGRICAIIVAVLGQSDIFDAIELIVIQPSLLASYVSAGWIQVVVVNWAHFMMGLGTLFISWLIIVQSESIMELFMNFAAIGFVMNIDDLFFALGNQYLFGELLHEKTEKLKRTNITVNGRPQALYRCYFLSILVAMFAGLFHVRFVQSDGQYLANTFTVSIGDDVKEIDSLFSGIYELKCNKFRLIQNSYITYVRNKPVSFHNFDVENTEYNQDREYGAAISYCETSNTWTLSSYDSSSSDYCKDLLNKNDSVNPCKRIILQSPKTKTYDFSTLSPSQWTIKSNTGRFVPVTKMFKYKDTQCTDNLDCSPIINEKNGGTCNMNDKKDKLCKCDYGRFGKNCEHPPPCQELIEEYKWEVKWEEFSAKALLIHEKQKPLKPFLFNDRPVYYIDNTIQFKNATLVLYQGVRWIKYALCASGKSRPKCSDFHKKFNDSFTVNDFIVGELSGDTTVLPYSPHIYSKPTTYGSPAGLYWYRKTSRLGIGTGQEDSGLGTLKLNGARFLCPDCSIPFNICDFGTCNKTTHKCVCDDGYSGSLCQIPDSY